MKEDFNDIEFKQLLQEKAHKAGENAWFTPRVLNRLPEKNKGTSFLNIEKWCYIIAMILCVVCWGGLFLSGYFNVITVRSLIYITGLSIGTIVLTVQSIRTAFLS